MGDLVRITGQREESVLRQMDDGSAGVGVGQYGRDTKPSAPTGRESVRFLRLLNRVDLPKHGPGGAE